MLNQMKGKTEIESNKSNTNQTDRGPTKESDAHGTKADICKSFDHGGKKESSSRYMFE
jgi:hypothetical protein